MSERMVTVCARCKKASCWRGLFFCDDALHANVERLPVSELERLGLEHSDYYAESADYPE